MFEPNKTAQRQLQVRLQSESNVNVEEHFAEDLANASRNFLTPEENAFNDQQYDWYQEEQKHYKEKDL